MARMVPGIETIEQHQQRLKADPDAYRPERCPHCGAAGLHHHGYYARNAPRGEGLALVLEPVLIPRFLCRCCRRSCSRLPACLSPRRQYRWRLQQMVLERLLAGASLREAARASAPSRHTVGRWWRRLGACFAEHGFHLRSRFAELGRAVGLPEFWRACLDRMGLAEAMVWLDHDGVSVP
jgi:transposase-like protein